MQHLLQFNSESFAELHLTIQAFRTKFSFNFSGYGALNPYLQCRMASSASATVF
jgi:hypothetical protein